jgi:serine protease Do
MIAMRERVRALGSAEPPLATGMFAEEMKKAELDISDLIASHIRDGKPIELSYQPEAAPKDFVADTKSKSNPGGVKMESLGLELGSLTPEVAKQLEMEGQKGVVITQVKEGSAAETAGLERGMVIVQVNRQDVATAKDFEKAIAADLDGSILMLVRSGKGSRFVVIQK